MNALAWEPSTRPWLTRSLWAAMGAVAWVVISLSRWLTADGRGHGTHEQLGLPPCRFEAVTHIPCPGCGLTTSFTHMAHFDVVSALRAHPMGPALFLLTLFVALASPFAIRRAYPVNELLARREAGPVLGVTLALGLGTFAFRLLHR